MIIGVPKEIKEMENRVGATPAGVNELTRNGNQVLVEAGAGVTAWLVLPAREPMAAGAAGCIDAGLVAQKQWLLG